VTIDETGLVNGFTEHPPNVTVSKYSAIVNSHIPYFTRVSTMTCCLFVCLFY
jgi:hypothetical protein